MCGLLGVAVKKGSALTPELAGLILSQLMLRNEKRGGDSFGLGVVKPDTADVKMYKTTGKVSEKAGGTKAWTHGIREAMEAIRKDNTTVVIGHNRKATTGANTPRNAHPFLCGKPGDPDFVFGAHNGVVGVWEDVAKHWKIQNRMEVDSEVIFRGIQKHYKENDGDVQVLGELIPMASIAASYMRDLHTLRLYRGDNPLAIAIGEGYVIWSSEEFALKETTFGLNVTRPKIGTDTLVTIDLQTFDVDDRRVPKRYDLQQALYPRRQNSFRPRKAGSAIVGARPYDHPDREDFTDKLFRGPDVERTDDGSAEADSCDVEKGKLIDCNGDIIPISSKMDDKFPALTDYPSLVPSKYLLVPRNKKDLYQCCSCKVDANKADKGTHEVPGVEKWELLWVGGDPLCPICYYYLVQADAEADLAQSRRDV